MPNGNSRSLLLPIHANFFIGVCTIIALASSFGMFLSAEEPLAITVSREIQADGQVIVFDLGKHLPATRVRAILQLLNKTGRDLNLSLQPSCNCTDLSVEEVKISAAGSESIQFDMIVPKSGVTSASINCVDVDMGFRFTIGLKNEAVQPVTLEAKRVAVDSRGGDEVKVVVLPSIPDLKLSELELDFGSRWALRKLSIEGEKWVVGLRRVETVPPGFYEEYLKLNCKVLDGKGAVVDSSSEFLIAYSDRFRLGPSFVVPKFVGEEIKFMVFATGERVAENEKNAKLSLVDESGAIRLDVPIESSRMRKGSLLIEALVSNELCASAIRESQGKPMALELSLGKMVSSTRVQLESFGESK